MDVSADFESPPWIKLAIVVQDAENVMEKVDLSDAIFRVGRNSLDVQLPDSSVLYFVVVK